MSNKYYPTRYTGVGGGMGAIVNWVATYIYIYIIYICLHILGTNGIRLGVCLDTAYC